MHSHAAFGGIGHTVVANFEKRNENEINKTYTALNESLHTAMYEEQNTFGAIAPLNKKWDQNFHVLSWSFQYSSNLALY